MMTSSNVTLFLFSYIVTLCISKYSYLSAQSEKSVFVCVWGGGGAAAQSIERVTPREEAVGSIPALAAFSLPVGSVSV